MSKHKFRKKSAYSILPRRYCKNCHYEIKQDYRNKRKLNGCNYDSEYNKKRRNLNPLCNLEYQARKKKYIVTMFNNLQKTKKIFKRAKIKIKKLETKVE